MRKYEQESPKKCINHCAERKSGDCMRVSVELLDYDDRDEEIANRPLFRQYNRERTGIL